MSSTIHKVQQHKPETDFCEKADAFRREKMYKEAVSNYLNAILIDRQNVESYYGLGICYKYLKQYAKAIRYLTTASELNPESYEIYFELGLCHLLEGSPCGAIKNFIKKINYT